MPIHEIRESIEQDKIILDGNGFGIVQKVVNLKDNMSHKMLQCDAYYDNPLPEATNGYTMELIVSPTPIIYTDMIINGYPSRAPAAANENILFKQTRIIVRGASDPPTQEFPNRFISARPTFTWYMPKLYVTLFIHGTPGDEINDLALSVYCAIEDKNTTLVTYGMGVIREDHIAQVAAVMSNGRFILPVRNVGQTYPMWKYGGVRPEYMISGASIANFFSRTDSQEAQNTNTTTNLRAMAKAARQMVPNLEAFGSLNTGIGDIPSWISMHLFKGVESGAIRDQWPPIKHADNGNVLTL